MLGLKILVFYCLDKIRQNEAISSRQEKSLLNISATSLAYYYIFVCGFCLFAWFFVCLGFFVCSLCFLFVLCVFGFF